MTVRSYNSSDGNRCSRDRSSVADREIDALDAERIASDPRDRVLGWKEIKDEFIVNRIAERRKARGLTQKELARRLKLRPSTISRMESRRANLTLATLRKIAKALGCSVPELIS
jgi:ribosome-binding protein aMBF1 (putative translation factor)